MSRQIQITAGKLSEPAIIELREDEAPETCETIWKALPIEGKLVHGQVSGEETFVAQSGDDIIYQQPENWEFQAIPRDVGYWNSHWEEGSVVRNNEKISEIVFVYGRNIRIRKDAYRPSAINLFGEIIQNFDDFGQLSKQARYEENPYITLRKDDS